MGIELREQICELIEGGARPVSFGEVISGNPAGRAARHGVMRLRRPADSSRLRFGRAAAIAAAVIAARQPAGAATRRHSRPAIGIGVAAAAAAGAVAAAAVLSPGGAPAGPGAAQRSARQILLTAATAAARSPADSGTYWYVRTWWPAGGGGRAHLEESWSRRNGETWVLEGGKLWKLPRYVGGYRVAGPFWVDGQERRFRQIQDLPTQPAALKQWIVTNAVQHGSKYGGPTSNKARVREAIFDSLTSLVSQLPAPPKVRAAAFRVLALLPGVTNLGPVKGGQALQFTLLGGQHATLVVDPSTGRVRDTSFYVGDDGAEVWSPTPGMTITAQWTNTLPNLPRLSP